MSKELTPLEALKELKKRYGKNFSLNDDERCRIIEKELKAQEQYVQIAEKEHEDYMALCGEITRLKNKHKKQLKALEIIKKLLNDDWTYFKLEENWICIDGSSSITQEEYDLLKEVLYENNQ